MQPYVLIGNHRIDLRAPGDLDGTPPRTRGARTLPNYTGGGPYGLDVGPDITHAEMHLATARPCEHGSGPLVDIVCDDPDWWDQVAASAAATAQAIRELDAERAEPDEDDATLTLDDRLWHLAHALGETKTRNGLPAMGWDGLLEKAAYLQRWFTEHMRAVDAAEDVERASADR